jgi:hypothetical protein
MRGLVTAGSIYLQERGPEEGLPFNVSLNRFHNDMHNKF